MAEGTAEAPKIRSHEVTCTSGVLARYARLAQGAEKGAITEA